MGKRQNTAALQNLAVIVGLISRLRFGVRSRRVGTAFDAHATKIMVMALILPLAASSKRPRPRLPRSFSRAQSFARTE